LAVLAPFVVGGAGIFEISIHDHFRQLGGNALPFRLCCHGNGIRSSTIFVVSLRCCLPSKT
jgi:hypothetical protein